MAQNAHVKSKESINGKESAESNLPSRISDGMGNIFYELGVYVATSPVKAIAFSVLAVLLCTSGFVCFHNEKNPLKLWIPQDSKFLRDTEWLMESFEEAFRLQTVLITAPDVLQPEVFQKLAKISKAVKDFKVRIGNGTMVGFDDICFKIPMVAELTVTGERMKRDAEDENDVESSPVEERRFHSIFSDETEPEVVPRKARPYNPSVDLPPSVFCAVANQLPLGCMQKNILELWNFNEEKINSLTKEDILNIFHSTNISATSGHETDFEQLLGGITRNGTGHIVAATGLLTQWMVYVNFSDVDHDKTGNSLGTEDWGSEEALTWELTFLDVLQNEKRLLDDNTTEIFYSAGRSFGDISAGTMMDDMKRVFVGGAFMFIFLQVVLSKFSWTELRVGLSSFGLLTIGIAFLSTIGLCSFMGISYGPVHTSLPFLLMGLGVDDMFVMMACWRKIQAERPPLKSPTEIPNRIGEMLRLAGPAITVTSFTDVVSFSVGSVTVLPSLQSFCLFAGVGVFVIWSYTVTFFVAIFALDELRILANRNGLVPCIIHRQKPKFWCDLQLMDRALKFFYTKMVLTKAGKIITLMSVVGITAISFRDLLDLEQRFDPNWFIPEQTYLHKYNQQKAILYPDQGYEAMILMGKLNYSQDLHGIIAMQNTVEQRTDLVHAITSWIPPFQEFVHTHFDQDIYKENLTDLELRTYLSKFLYTTSGGKYRANLKFASELECGKPTDQIIVSAIEFKYKRFNGRNSYVPAMHTMESIVDGANLHSGDGFATVWGRIYGNWITDEIIDTELLRNIMMALGCVMACTAVMCVDFQTCFWIFVCIILTLINVCGWMQRWGLTIDVVSCVGLELSVGFCVDFAAHVGHAFLMEHKGSRDERILEALLHIGPAVLYGGTSTLLALTMLASSEAYTFRCFFKIFLLVVIFGLFFGIVFLPVVLSLIGPKAYKQTAAAKTRETELMDLSKNPTEMLSFIEQVPSDDPNANKTNELLSKA